MRKTSKRRSKRTTLVVRGIMVEAVTISGLSEIIGKSRVTLLRYEKNDVIPPAPIVYRSVRYYPLSLAKRLVPLVAKLPLHKKPEQELIVEINKLFKEEREKLCL